MNFWFGVGQAGRCAALLAVYQRNFCLSEQAARAELLRDVGRYMP
jgi:hypothetical protein